MNELNERTNTPSPVREKLMRYFGIFKGDNLTAEEIDRIVGEETEKLLRKELKRD